MFTFFTQHTKSKPIAPACGACGLLRKCTHGMQKARPGTAKAVIVVDKPSADRNISPAQYERIEGNLRKIGHSLRELVIVPAQACYSESDTAGEEPWKHCQPLLISEIKRLQPEKVLIWGKTALKSVIHWLWDQNAEMPDRWFWQGIPSKELNAWVFPIGRIALGKNPAVSEIYHTRQMLKAFNSEGRPYGDHIADYAKMVQMPESIAEIKELLAEASLSPLTAFDYETNSLKPERQASKVYTASVAWLVGDETRCVAFSMTDALVDAWKAYLTSDCRKIAANLKFEDRWSRTKYGVTVKNWVWDNVIAAHMHDPQPGVAGLKFQAFARLGQAFYAHNVDKYFEDSDTYGLNKVHLANRRELMLYNGIDSLAELDLGILQMYEAGLQKAFWTRNLPKQSYYQYGEIL